jgi:hypothetical protein
MNLRAITLSLSLLFFLPVGGLCSRAGDSQPTEYQVKAAFVFNFAKFVEWPSADFPSTDTPIRIGVVCESGSSFEADLKITTADKTINGRRLVINRVTSPQEMKACHIIFVCRLEKSEKQEKRRLEALFQSLQGSSVLTVGESDAFIPAGGIINFVTEDRKIRFEIKDAAARQAGLKISSKLLTLARKRDGGT